MILLRYTAEHLRARPGRNAATVAVVAMVVMATALFSGLVSSIERTLVGTGSERNLVVLRAGASSDGSSSVSLADYRRLRLLPGIARDAAGDPLVSPELVIEPTLRRPGGRREHVLVRGVGRHALAVHDEVRMGPGRMLRPGSREAVVGRALAERFGVEGPDEVLRLGRSEWSVVGVFGSDGSAFESEVWVDVEQLAADVGRPHPYSGLRVRLAAGASAAALARRIADDPQSALSAEPETDYYAEQAEAAAALRALVFGLALLAGTAASFGAANTLYASVSARRREIGTLSALGFRARTIGGSVLLESLLVCFAGFVVGCALAWGAGHALDRTLAGVGLGAANSMRTQAVELRVAASDLGLGLALVGAIAGAGAMLPALRAARLAPAEALRRGP